jgi:DNA-binding CsgD family transcriptional regulator
MAEVEALDEEVKEPMAACCDLGIAAVIRFHRGDHAAARASLAASVPRAERIGSQVIGSLLLARSMDREEAGGPAEALAVLTAGFAENAEELDEIEDLLPDAVRLATETGDLTAAGKLAGHAVSLAAGSEIPHRQATALYCRGMLEHDTAGLLTAAERYADAGRPLLSAKALEAAATGFLRGEDRDKARAAFIQAVEIYTSLGAAADVSRLQASFRAHGIRRGPTAKHRQARSGWDSLTPTETKVAALVVEGLSNPEIATKLLLSRRTVATHVSHILRKLGVNSRIDIAREAALRTSTPE